jgi:hypothetical protein
MSSRIQATALLFAKTAELDVLAGTTPWALEDELMAYAREHAAPGESEGAAITRLCREDPLAKALARAAYHAEQLLQRTATSEERVAAFRKHLGAHEADPAAEEMRFRKKAAAESGLDETAPAIYAALERIAKAEAQPGEDFYSAFSRLAHTDRDFQAGLRLYDRAHRRS